VKSSSCSDGNRRYLGKNEANKLSQRDNERRKTNFIKQQFGHYKTS
jgi:hypothetical protein